MRMVVNNMIDTNRIDITIKDKNHTSIVTQVQLKHTSVLKTNEHNMKRETKLTQINEFNCSITSHLYRKLHSPNLPEEEETNLNRWN